jgi:hypothetical protein
MKKKHVVCGVRQNAFAPFSHCAFAPLFDERHATFLIRHTVFLLRQG